MEVMEACLWLPVLIRYSSFQFVGPAVSTQNAPQSFTYILLFPIDWHHAVWSFALMPAGWCMVTWLAIFVNYIFKVNSMSSWNISSTLFSCKGCFLGLCRGQIYLDVHWHTLVWWICYASTSSQLVSTKSYFNHWTLVHALTTLVCSALF